MEEQAVLVSLIGLIRDATAIVNKQYPNTICIRASGNGKLETIPQSYQFLFRAENQYAMYTINVTQNLKTGELTWSPIAPFKPIVGVTGNLARCTVDIYPAYKAIRQAGYQDPVYFCSLFQAESLGIHEPWYCFTPTDCHWVSAENYIFVNSLTGEVRLFPSDGSPAGLGAEAQEQPSA